MFKTLKSQGILYSLHSKSREKRKEFENEDKNNQRVPKANLWIINYCILKMKADTMNLQLVHRYILSLSKNKNMVFEEKKKKKRTKNKLEKKNSNGERRNPDLRLERSTAIIYCPRTTNMKTRVKLIIYTIFAHEILPVDAV